ncbi:MAG: acetate kinase [Alphaproteobacteria bacterium]|nr:MAG: acetate kinase [Alphaproteobacteria bacterium]
MPAILALNSGSSSVKFALFDERLRPTLKAQVENIGAGLSPRLTIVGGGPSRPIGGDSHGAIIGDLIRDVILPAAGEVAGVGHRVVHGGTRFAAPARIDADVRAEIARLAPLAPSHQPHNLAGIDAIAAVLPHVSQVACFDTAFHRTIPEHRQMMALPRRFAGQGLLRFGFHGLSYQSIVAALPALIGGRADGRIVACHLGNGCSLAGIVAGASHFTSMGFTPLDGLVMGRRPGRLDPGAVLWLVERHGGDTEVVRRLLNQESGLLGVSGISPDMRDLLASGEATARLAVTMFVDRLAQEIGAAAAATGGIDALVFTGGIGENAAPIRATAIAALSFLGLTLDAAANARHGATISAKGARPSAHVVATDEEAVIAAAVRQLL